MRLALLYFLFLSFGKTAYSNETILTGEADTTKESLCATLCRVAGDSPKEDRVAIAEKSAHSLIRVIARTKIFPPTTPNPATGESQLSEALGINYAKWSGKRAYADGEPYKRIHDSLLKAVEHAFEQLELVQGLDDSQKDIVRKVLREKIEHLKFETLPLPEKKNVLSDRLIQVIAQIGSYPSTSPDKITQEVPLNEALGIYHARWVGTGDYRDGYKSHKARIHNSALEALEHALERLDSNPTQQELSPNNDKHPFNKDVVRKVLEDKIAEIKFESLPLAQKKKVLSDRLIKVIAETNAFPSTTNNKETGKTPLTEALGILHGRWLGTGNYRHGYKLSYDRIHKSGSKALKHVLIQLKSNKELDPSKKKSVQTILEKRLKKELAQEG